MGKKLLREIEISGCSILSEDKAKNTMNILASWGQSGVENKNKRTYLKSLLQREIARVQKSVEEGSFIGTGDHPLSGHADIATASHIVEKLWIDDSGKCWTKLKILPTSRGKSVMEIIKGGGKLGLSSRSFGTVKNGIVQDDLQLVGLDIVMNPSAPGAAFSKENIFESADFTPETEEQKKRRLIDEHHEQAVKEAGLKSKEDLMWLVYNRDTSRNLFRGSFEEWKKLNEKYIDIAIAETTEDLTYEEAVVKVMGETEAEKILRKEQNIQEHVQVKDVYMEALACGVHPREYCEKINAEIDRQNESVCEDETKMLLREAQNAGLDVSDPEVREKYLNSILQNKINAPTEKVLTEKEKVKKKIAENIEDERLRNSYLAGEKILAGGGLKKK